MDSTYTTKQSTSAVESLCMWSMVDWMFFQWCKDWPTFIELHKKEVGKWQYSYEGWSSSTTKTKSQKHTSYEKRCPLSFWSSWLKRHRPEPDFLPFVCNWSMTFWHCQMLAACWPPPPAASYCLQHLYHSRFLKPQTPTHS